MIRKAVDTYQIHLYMSGPIEVAKQVIREECMDRGLCVTITPTTYMYTGGEEVGYIVGLLNYPRFPTSPAELDVRAFDLMHDLLEATFQYSGLMVTPTRSEWISVRPGETQ